MSEEELLYINHYSTIACKVQLFYINKEFSVRSIHSIVCKSIDLCEICSKNQDVILIETKIVGYL
jgi:hypothetical protein